MLWEWCVEVIWMRFEAPRVGGVEEGLCLWGDHVVCVK